MASLLRIDASPRGNASVSRRLGDTFTDAWKSAHAGDTVVTRDLAFNQPTYVDVQWIESAFTPQDERTENHQAALRLSDEYIAEIKAASEILITTPFYNFNVPAVLKAWIDHIVRAGVTFAYVDGNFKGLLEDKKVTVVLAAGGKYQGTPISQIDYATPYLKFILGFMGLTNVAVLDAGGVKVYPHQGLTEEQFLQPLREQAAELAKA